MKLHHLRAVVAISEQGSLRGAARHLRVAQPTLTRGLSELERELGAPLFERRPKGMIATQLGATFIRRATMILNDVRKAQEEFAQMRGNAIGTVSIGLSSVAHILFLPKVLRPFRRKFPKVRLHVLEGYYPTLEQSLQDGSVDLYVGPDPGLSLPLTLQKEFLFTGRRSVMCRLGHPLAKASSLKELVDAEWITTSITPRAENELGDIFKLHGLPPPLLALRSQSSLTFMTCLASSDLLAMVPAQWLDSPFANRVLTAIPVREELKAPPIIVVKRSDVPLAPAAAFLLDLVRRSAGHLNGSKGASAAQTFAAGQPLRQGRAARPAAR